MLCADPNPWDASLLCELVAGHAASDEPRGELHDSDGIRWADRCHFPGDSCPLGTHREVNHDEAQ